MLRHSWSPIDGPDDYRLHRNICYGGGGGGAAPAAPDYSNYISAMTTAGNQMLDHSNELYDWAKKQGLDLTNLGQTVSKAAGTAADTEQGRADTMMDKWSTDYDPLYASQRADAARMQANLPQTEESYAGKFGADAAQAIDQQLQAEQRKQTALGISPGVGSTALDQQARIGRAMATSAAGEQGRMQARTEARNVTGNAIQTGQFIPGVAGQQAGLATSNRGQEAAVPATMAGTSAGLYGPSNQFANTAYAYKAQQLPAMGQGFNESLASWKATQENDDGGIMSTIAPMAMGLAGSYFGPMGAAAGQAAGKAMFSKTGGKIPANGGRRIPRFAAGGAIDTGPPGGGDDGGHFIPPEASPSGGQNVDDVHAAVSAGEFVIPERTVDWYGEKFFQNLISKADNEAQQESVAQPEEHEMNGPQMAAIDASPPMFRSEGARV